MENRSSALLSKNNGAGSASPKGKRGDYRRAAVADVPLLFCALRFASYFFAVMRCLRQATRLVLFILSFLSVLFLNVGGIVKVDLAHIVALFSTVVVFVFASQFILVFMLAAQDTVLDIGSYCLAATLRGEAHFAEHTGVLILFANNQTYLTVLHSQNGRRVPVTPFHEINQAVGQTWLYLSDILTRSIAHADGMPDHVQLHGIAY